MATPAQIRNAIDDKLASIWSAVQTKQANHLAANGKYFQGILTPVVTPTDGEETAPDETLKPTDQIHTWSGATFNLPATIPMAIALDSYDGPNGKGFVGRVEVVINGNRWRRTAQIGPETYRTKAWAQVD